MVWHNGITGGFRTFVGFLPDDGRGLVVLANGQGDVDALARRLLDPSEPPLPTHGASVIISYAITLILLGWGPLLLFQSIRHAADAARDASGVGILPSSVVEAKAAEPRTQPRRPKIDRFDVLRRSLSLAVMAYAVLVRQARALPWRRAGMWSAIGRGLTTVLEVAVLTALFS